MSFSQSNFYVGEYEGQVLPELVLSVPTPFDFTVSVNSSNVNLSSKLCVYYCVKTCIVNICMHTGLQLVCAWFVKKIAFVCDICRYGTNHPQLNNKHVHTNMTRLCAAYAKA